MNLPLAFSQLKKVRDYLKLEARDCTEIWEPDDDEENYCGEKKVAEREYMDRQELLQLQRHLRDTADEVTNILENLVDPWRPLQSKVEQLKREEEEAKARATAKEQAAKEQAITQIEAADDKPATD
jgi:hypothetical protein